MLGVVPEPRDQILDELSVIEVAGGVQVLSGEEEPEKEAGGGGAVPPYS